MRRQLITAVLLLILVCGIYVVWSLLHPSKGAERLGFISGVTTNGNYGILFDEAKWLTGKEGEDAAIAADLCTEATRSSCLPNDFIIQNTSLENEPLEFANDITITMTTLKMEKEGVKPTVITRQDLQYLINDPKQNWRELPYRITVKNNLVTSIEEVYVP